MGKNRKWLVMATALGILCSMVLAAANQLSQVIEVPEASAKLQKEQRWEYCFAGVTEVYGSGKDTTTGKAEICYLRPSGPQCEGLEATVAGELQKKSRVLASRNVLSKALSKLGNQGWELVSDSPDSENGTGGSVFYFKKLITP